MIEHIHAGSGQPRAKCICDDCGRDEVVAAPRDADGVALKKLQNHGWTYLGKTLRCPSCEAKRKMKKPMTEQKAETPQEPTRAQKRKIMEMLDECYDVEAESYTGGDTDASVADVLGVMPGWVSQLREEFYGPSGGNEEIDKLREDFKKLDKALSKQLDEATKAIKAAVNEVEVLRKLRPNISTGAARLERIEKAVGAHVMKKAGLS